MKKHEENIKAESVIKELDKIFKAFMEKRYLELLQEENDFRKNALKKVSK
jgi:hypothetical protein